MKWTAAEVLKLNEEIKNNPGCLERIKTQNSSLYHRIREDLLKDKNAAPFVVENGKFDFIEICNDLIEMINEWKLREKLGSLNHTHPKVGLR